MAWGDENRLMALSDNDKSRHYTYNAASERMSLKIFIPATTLHLKVEGVIELVEFYIYVIISHFNLSTR